MSVDPWGGGSDLDPKLRLKELGTYRPSAPDDRQTSRRPIHILRKPTVSVLDALLLMITLVGLLVVYLGTR